MPFPLPCLQTSAEFLNFNSSFMLSLFIVTAWLYNWPINILFTCGKCLSKLDSESAKVQWRPIHSDRQSLRCAVKRKIANIHSTEKFPNLYNRANCLIHYSIFRPWYIFFLYLHCFLYSLRTEAMYSPLPGTVVLVILYLLRIETRYSPCPRGVDTVVLVILRLAVVTGWPMVGRGVVVVVVILVVTTLEVIVTTEQVERGE